MSQWLSMVALLLGLTTLCANAVPILGVTATSATPTTFGTTSNIVDGTGLTGGQLASSLHAQSIPANAWQSFVAPSTVELTFDLHGLYDVVGMAVWNASGVVNRVQGIRSLTVSSSTDGVTFVPVVGAPTLLAQGAVAGSSAASGIHSWAPVSATHLRFSVGSNFGSVGVGGIIFNEVLFDGLAAAPEMDPRQGLLPLFTAILLLMVAGDGRLRSLSGKAKVTGGFGTGLFASHAIGQLDAQKVVTLAVKDA